MPIFSLPSKYGIGCFSKEAYEFVDLLKEAGQKKLMLHDAWLGLECLNLLGINNVNSYYWITDVTNQQYAVPNYLTGRQINVKLTVNI